MTEAGTLSNLIVIASLVSEISLATDRQTDGWTDTHTRTLAHSHTLSLSLSLSLSSLLSPLSSLLSSLSSLLSSLSPSLFLSLSLPLSLSLSLSPSLFLSLSHTHLGSFYLNKKRQPTVGNVLVQGCVHSVATWLCVWLCVLWQMILLNALGEPLPRPLYDYILRSQQVDQVYEMLRVREVARSSRHRSIFAEEHESMNQVCLLIEG